jgi:hypothetical protein
MLMAAPKARAREAAVTVVFMVYLLDELDIFRFIAGARIKFVPAGEVVGLAPESLHLISLRLMDVISQ